MDDKEWELRIHPDVDPEVVDILLNAMAEGEVSTGEVRQLADAPEDGNCPECGTALVVQKVWDDEWECPNTECVCYTTVSFLPLDGELAQTLLERMNDIKNLE